MSKPAPMSHKKRKLEDGMKGKIQKSRKRTRRQEIYHSSSDEDEGTETNYAPINLGDSDEEAPVEEVTAKSGRKANKQAPKAEKPAVESEDSPSGSETTDPEEDDSDASDSPAEKGITKRKTSKRNDPEAFSTSISKILSTKLSQSVRNDPVLSRSKEATETSNTIANERLERRAKAKIRAEKKEELDRGRVKDVVGVSTGETGKIAEEEKRLRKIAQRGVVKLFNAVRAAQVKGEQAAREERKKGTVGMTNREEKVNEMSKQGFLDLISGTPKGTADAV